MPTTTLLAIDTATEFCSVALLIDDRLDEICEHVGQRHSEHALPMVDRLLGRCGIALRDVDAIVFGAGPGSFTGLRIACGIAQGLAFGIDKPVIAVGNLRALAARAFAQVEHGDRLLAAVDARMNEMYCAVYQRDAWISELRAPALAAPALLPQLAGDERVEVIAGDALTRFAETWPGGRWTMLPTVRPSAADIVRLARIDHDRGLAVPPALAAPLYVRDRVALTIEERREKVREAR